MARDSNGNYSLPQPAFVDGTIADAVPLNADLSDMATALTQSVASTGVTPLTGPIKFFAGTSSAPGITFNSDTTTGFELLTSGSIGITCSGALVGQVSSGGWAGMTLLGPTISNATFSGGLTLTSPTINTPVISGSVGGEISFSATDQIVLPVGSTGQQPGSPSSGGIRFNSSTNLPEVYNGTVWVSLGKAPTYTSKTSTGTGVYTPPTGCLYYKVRMVAAGGGGGSTTGTGAGGNASQTSLGTWTAIGGSGGNSGNNLTSQNGGAGGTGGTNGVGTLIVRLAGGRGGDGQLSSASANSQGGPGGGSALFGGGGAQPTTGASGGGNGYAGVANTGGGGSGGGSGTSVDSGGGGGAGESVEFIVTTPLAVGFSVGGNGTGASSGANGGNGGTGVILIEEHYC